MRANLQSDLTSHQTLAIIDTALEIKVGVGYDWKPVVLGNDEIQIPSQLAKYLNVTIGDEVLLSFDFSGLLSDKFVHYAKTMLSEVLPNDQIDMFLN